VPATGSASSSRMSGWRLLDHADEAMADALGGAAIEAEHELVEIRREVLAADGTVMNGEQLALGEAEDQVDRPQPQRRVAPGGAAVDPLVVTTFRREVAVPDPAIGRDDGRPGDVGAEKAIETPGALMQTEDSHGQADLRCWAHSSDRVSLSLGRGSYSSRGDRGRSQPRPEEYGAGSDHPGIGRTAAGGRSPQACPGQSPGGLAPAAALRRSQDRRAAARCHPQARQSACGRPDRVADRDPDSRRAAQRSDPLDRTGDGLARRAAARPTRLDAEIGFVGLDPHGQGRTMELEHCLVDVVQPQPRRLIAAEAYLALQLNGPDPALARSHQVDGKEPLGEPGFGLLQDRAGQHQVLLDVGCTLVEVAPPRRISLAATVGPAAESLRRALAERKVRTLRVGAEPGDERRQVLRQVVRKYAQPRGQSDPTISTRQPPQINQGLTVVESCLGSSNQVDQLADDKRREFQHRV
jgi:hypothetical protein